MDLFAFGFLKRDGFIRLIGKHSTPENFMNPVIREKNYNALDNKKLACICEKFKDSPDRLLGSSASPNLKKTAQKRSMDALK
ncbi:hypothetical protein AMTRI_Chr13g124740 [Amborella trichopoda]